MNMKFMTSMKCMKLTVKVYLNISLKYDTIVCLFLHQVIIISSDNSTDG